MDQTKIVIKILRPQWDDDNIDKLNYFWTTLLLILGSLTIAMKQYVGSPLQCWVPVEFKKFWEEYAEHYCFVENTYFVQMNQTIPDSGEMRVQRELGYYQWVPIVLALQAFLFVLPRLAWTMLNTQGLNVPAIVQGTQETQKGGDKKRRLKGSEETEKQLKVVSSYINEAVQYRGKAARRVNTSATNTPADEIDPPYHLLDQNMRRQRSLLDPISVPTRLFGYYTTTVYLLIKLAYVTNVIGQLFIMNSYLAPEYTWWGFGILNDLAHGRLWHESGHFPRVTLCDFTVRKLGQLQTYTIQCVLVLNMLNEKLYLILWWWFLVLAILSILNFLYWLVVSFNPLSRRRFVARYLWARGLVSPPRPEDQDDVRDFVNSYLKPDGVTVLRLISSNAGEIACANLVQQLWFLKYPKSIPKAKNDTAPTAPDDMKMYPSIDQDGFKESEDANLIGDH